MQYKTIILELLQQRPQMHDRLRQDRMLLPTMERYAQKLKDSHEAWKERLLQARPSGDQTQLASHALEMALVELENHLPSESPQNDPELLSLDHAMAFVRRHTPRA